MFLSVPTWPWLHFCMSYPHYNFNASLSVRRLMHILEALVSYLMSWRERRTPNLCTWHNHNSADFWADDLFHCYHSNIASAKCVHACARTQNTSYSGQFIHHTTDRLPVFHSTWSILTLITFSVLTQLEMRLMSVMRKKFSAKKRARACVCVCLFVQICVAACLIPLCKRSPWLEEVFTSRRRGV